MPPESFLMTGGSAPFRPPGTCPGSGGPHYGSPGEGSYLVADAATKDGSASARVALWRCRLCGSLLVGIGRAGVPVDAAPGTGVHAQEFTWLEDTQAVALPGPGNRQLSRDGGP
jgi:hypothetical protein